MSRLKKIIKRALQHGFNLSDLPDYNPKEFKSGLYDYLVEEKYFVTEEPGYIYVGHDILEDVVEITFEHETMKVQPLAEEGFFEIFIHLFKYISLCSLKEAQDYADEETESYSEEDSSEEIWL